MERIWQGPDLAARGRVVMPREAMALVRATGVHRCRPAAPTRDSEGSRMTGGEAAEICTVFVTDQRPTTANAAE